MPKTKLSFKKAFKLGAETLSYSKIRLVITVLLSCLSIMSFAFSDALCKQNFDKIVVNSIDDTGINYIATIKSKRVEKDAAINWSCAFTRISKAEIKQIKKDTGVDMQGVYVPLEDDLYYDRHLNPDVELNAKENSFYRDYFTGFSKISDETLKKFGFKILAGKLPDGNKNEIAISEYTFEVFKKGQYTDGVPRINASGKEYFIFESISDYKDMVGKTIEWNLQKYTITAVIDTNFDIERYSELALLNEHNIDADKEYMLNSEFNTALNYSYTSTAMTGDGFIEKLVADRPDVAMVSNGYLDFTNDYISIAPKYLARFSDVADEKIIWIDKAKKALGEKEIIITSDYINDWYTNSEENLTDEQRAKYISESVKKIKENNNLTAFLDAYSYKISKNVGEYKIVGIIDEAFSKMTGTAVCSKELYNDFTDGNDCVYSFCIGETPKEKSKLKNFVKYCSNEDDATRFSIQNAVTFEIEAMNEPLNFFSKGFFYLGLVFTAFAVLMFANFIGVSIAYKKREIEELGAENLKQSGVSRIFFAESFIIAMISFALALIGVFLTAQIINHLIKSKTEILITLLNFGSRQVCLLLVASILLALVASYIPIKRITLKRPESSEEDS